MRGLPLKIWQPGKVTAVCVSAAVGQVKTPVDRVKVRAGYGIVGDAHGGSNRQVSMLDAGRVAAFRKQYPGIAISPGRFAENLLVAGIDWSVADIGDEMQISGIRMRLTQKGKECHSGCAIKEQTGECIMPSHGLFFAALDGGMIKPGDPVYYPIFTFSIAVLTVSDRCSRGETEDRSGCALVQAVRPLGRVAARAVIADEPDAIAAQLREWCDGPEPPALILTSGGTGLSPRDRTPEATGRLLDFPVPGLMELARRRGGENTLTAYLSRGLAGVRRRTLIINLPGSVAGAEETFAALRPLLPHALTVTAGRTADCGRGQ